jgi:hypothetical protein
VEGVDVKWWKREIPARERWIVGAASAIHRDLVKSDLTDRVKFLTDKSKKLIDETVVGSKTDVPAFFSSQVVVDQHTKKGSSNEDNFTFLGSNVVNEKFLLPPIFHAYYTHSKAFSTNVSEGFVPDIDSLLEGHETARKILVQGYRESVLLKPEIRAQLTCSASRPDTYFARLWGYPVFVKGPFLPSQEKHITSQLWVHENLKSKLEGMVSTKPWVCKMIPDQWESVPLGSRNSVKKYEPQLFVVWKSLFPHDVWPIPGRIVDSKLWPKTSVVDFSKLTQHVSVPDVTSMEKKAMINYIISCLWRFVAAIPDNAERNFLLVQSTESIYSLDEDAPFKESGPSPFKWSKVKNQTVLKFIDDNYGDIQAIVKKWNSVFEDVSELDDCPYSMEAPLERLRSVQTLQGLKGVFYYEWKTKGSKEGKSSPKKSAKQEKLKLLKPSEGTKKRKESTNIPKEKTKKQKSAGKEEDC